MYVFCCWNLESSVVFFFLTEIGEPSDSVNLLLALSCSENSFKVYLRASSLH